RRFDERRWTGRGSHVLFQSRGPPHLRHGLVIVSSRCGGNCCQLELLYLQGLRLVPVCAIARARVEGAQALERLFYSTFSCHGKSEPSNEHGQNFPLV